MNPRAMLKRVARAGRDELKAFTSGEAPLRGRRICWPRPGSVTIEDFAISGIGSGLIAVQNAVTVISPGTERAYFSGEPNTNIEFPYHPGYASAGTILVAGRGTPFRAGDRVASRTVHASMETVEGDRAALIPDGVSFEQAAFCQIAMISLQGIRRAQIQAGQRVLVIGRGPIGVLAGRLSLCSGATAADVIGVTEALQLSGSADYDVVMEASGRPEAMARAMQLARTGGTVVLLGSPRHAAPAVEFGSDVISRRLRVTAAHGSDVVRKADGSDARTWAEEAGTVLRLIAEGRLMVDDLITERIVPRDIPSFYHALAGGKRCLGVVLDWSGEPSAYMETPPVAARAGRAVRRIVAAARNPQRGTTKIANALRIGLVGCGEIGMANARAISLASSTTLVRVADPNGEAAADLGRRYGVPYSTDVQDLIHKQDIDAVFLCVPHYLHAPLAIDAAAAGMHVIVEKPMATNAADAEAMIAAARRAGVVLSVCFCTRYEPHIQRAADLIRAGALGEITATKVTYEEEKPLAYWTGGHSGRIKSNWRGLRAQSGGGVLIMNVCHYLDQLRFLTGLEVEKVSSEFATMVAPVEVEDLMSLSYRYQNGAIGTVLASTCSRGGGGRDLRIMGREGQLVLKAPCKFYSLKEIEGLPARKWHSFGKLPEVDERVRYVERFGLAVRNGWDPDISGEDGLAVQRMMDAAYGAPGAGNLMEKVEMVGAR